MKDVKILKPSSVLNSVLSSALKSKASLRGFTALLFTLLLSACGNEDAEQAFRDAIDIDDLNINSISIVIDSGNSTFAAGSTETARAMAQVSTGGDDIDVSSRVSWSSSEPFVLSIGANGRINTAENADSVATIFAQWGDLSASLPVNVSSAALASITVSGPSDVSACSAGHQYSATGNYGVGDDRNVSHLVTWTSNNTALARISNQGLADTLGAGNAGIIANLGQISSVPYALTVRDNLSSIVISPSASFDLEIGQTRQFTASARYSDGSAEQDITNTVTWASSATNFLSISNAEGNRGSARAIAVGNSAVNATCNTPSPIASANVAVEVKAVRTVSRLEVRFNNSTVIPDQDTNDGPLQLNAILVYSDGSTEDVTDNDDTDWTVLSSTGTAASINNTNDKGEANFSAVGRTTIQAEYELNGTRYNDDIELIVE